MTRRAVRVIGALLLIGLVRGGYGLIAAWRDDGFSTATLRAASEEINRQLPAYIGTELQLVHTNVNEGRFVYQLRLVNYKGALELPPATRQEMRQSMRQTACHEGKPREFLRHGVRLLYQFTAADGRPLAAIEIAPSDCGL